MAVRDVELDGWAWRECGEGPAVLFLHGLGGSRTSWDAQLAVFDGSCRCVAWDMPGYGAAAPLAGPLTFAALADAVIGLCDAASLDQPHLVGISFGGMIAQHAVLAYPGRFASLTLLATSPAFGLDGTLAADWRAARLAPLDRGLEPADFADAVLRSIAGPSITDEALAGQRGAFERISAAALRRSIDCLVTHDTRARLHEIRLPTRVMVGELDAETPVAYARALADAIPDATLTIVPGAGHLLNVALGASPILPAELARDGG